MAFHKREVAITMIIITNTIQNTIRMAKRTAKSTMKSMAMWWFWIKK